jgi:1-acyl-sn-glycerol-3-phosphate acyltransferase
MIDYATGDELRTDVLRLEPLLKTTWAFDLLKRYFHYEVQGLEKIPAFGPALLVMNHGLLVVDAVLLGLEMWRFTGRIIRFLGAHFLFQLPGLRRLFLTAGVVDGNPVTAADLLARGELAAVMPGGVPEACRTSDSRYELRWEGRTGFVSLALRTGVPIVPAFCIGCDDMYHVFSSGRRLEDLLGLRGFQLPLFWGLGPLPLPAKLTHYVGDPIFCQKDPEAAEDPAKVNRLHRQVRQAMLRLRDDGLAKRKGDVFALWPDGAGGESKDAAGGESKDAAGGESKDAAGGESKDAAGGESKDAAGGESKDAAGGESKDGAPDESKDGAGGESKDAAGGESKDAAGGESKDAAGGESKDAAGGESKEVG